MPFKSNLQAATDFQTLWGLTDAMTKDFGWTDGINKLYTNLTYDFYIKTRPGTSYSWIIMTSPGSILWLMRIWTNTCHPFPGSSPAGASRSYIMAMNSHPGKPSPNDGYVRLDFLADGKEIHSINSRLPAVRKRPGDLPAPGHPGQFPERLQCADHR